jgi:hypothetical protein
MHRHYVKMYPNHRYWHYSYGHRIATIAAYDADYYIGHVKNVYGRVSDVYYERTTDEYYLTMGPYYPYQHLTIVVPGHVARRYARHPARYFMSKNIKTTGLITSYEGKPEIIVKRYSQINVY